MEEASAKKKLQLIDEALNYFYDMDGDTLLANYQNEIMGGTDDQEKSAPPAMDRETALGLLRKIPDKCRDNKSMKMEPAMLRAVSEEDLLNLCEKQVQSHPDIELEIRSMFKFCMLARSQLEEG